MLTFKKKELFDLLKAWLAISLAFAILLSTTLTTIYGSIQGFTISLIISLLTAGLAFIIHEVSHKLIAQKFYCSAEFEADNKMLILAILMSFFGFIFAAPGAVIIKGGLTKKQNGLISLAGPLSNLLLAVLFFPGLIIFQKTNILFFFFFQGFFISSWLGLFNMIPFRPFDGQKIFQWNKFIYVSLTIFLAFFVFLGFQLF